MRKTGWMSGTVVSRAYAERIFPEIGGLMSYGPIVVDDYR
jgi:hypothetical protein